MTYIDLLHKELEASEERLKLDEERNYHKDMYGRSAQKSVERTKKIIALRKHKSLDIQEYNLGLVLINNKFVVSLVSNKWRIINKSKWYLHKEDVDHFVNTYIIGDKNETND